MGKNFQRKKTDDIPYTSINALMRKPFILFLVIFTVFVIFTGCTEYATFSSRVDELDFTFEYPKEWDIGIIEKYSELAHVNIIAPAPETESPVKVSVGCFYQLGSKAEQEAEDIISERISVESEQRILFWLGIIALL